MKKILIVFALLVLTATPSGAKKRDKPNNSSARTEAEIRRRLAQWVEALKSNDVTSLNQILADDFQYILDDGKTRNKTEEMAPNKGGDIKFETISLAEVKVFTFGDTAVATGIGSFKGTFKGRPFESRERFCDVYQKRKGSWQVIASRPVTLH